MISSQDFRNGMSLLTGAVNVITTGGAAGMAGVTASAVCSVTDEPPTLLVCLNRASYAHSFFQTNGVLGVSVLAASQREVSALFSDRNTTMPERFARVSWSPLVTGAPAIDDALVNFDGEIREARVVGTHSVFFVEVKAVRMADDVSSTPGLAYFNRRYHTLSV